MDDKMDPSKVFVNGAVEEELVDELVGGGITL